MPADPVTAAPTLPAPLPGEEPGFGAVKVAAGRCWRDSHEVLAARDAEERWFRARNLATGAEEWLWVGGPATAGRRDPVFQRLQALDCGTLQKAVACQVDTERVEIWGDAGQVTLREWRNHHPAPGAREIRDFVGDMQAALVALHEAGVGHFAIRPEHITVREGAEGTLRFCLTGLESAELLESSELIPISVNPLYAPPEAAGLYQHSPGPLLGAWDYWSLGRVLQEYILGHTVLELLPTDLRRRMPLSLSGQAESLLMERETGKVRAGGVEVMTELGRREQNLLRGLLTGAREARWGAADLRDWLDGRDPEEHYAAPRNRRFFRIDGRAYTPASAAVVLAGPAKHPEIVPQVFEVAQPGTLAHFLGDAPGYETECEQLETCRRLTELPALAPLPEALRREIAAAIGLLVLGRKTFRWRGEEVNEATLRARLADVKNFARVSAELRAISLPLVVGFLARHDSATGTFLEQLRQSLEGAETLLARQGWSRDRPHDVWLAAIEPKDRVKERLQAMHQRYARSTVKALDAVFQAPHPTPAMQVVLLWADAAAAKYGFLTHEQVRDAALAELAREGRALVKVLFWHRLERALRAVPLLFGRHWITAIAAVALIAAVAVHVPGPWGAVLGFGPVVMLVGLRLALWRWHQQLEAAWVKAEAPWSWRDGPDRCQREIRALVEQERLPGLESAVITALATVDQRLKELNAGQAVPATRRPPRQWATWAAALFVWMLLCGIAAGSGWRWVKHPPDFVAQAEAWGSFLHLGAKPKPFDPRISWPYRVALKPDLMLSTAEVFEATAAQEEAAVERGRHLTANYRPDTITSLVAIYVPLDDGRGGILLFDPRKGKILGKKGPVLNFAPMPRSWLSLEDQMILFIQK